MSSAGWPAACVFSYSGTPSLLNQDRFIRHFEALRAGTFGAVRFDDIEANLDAESLTQSLAFGSDRKRIDRGATEVQHRIRSHPQE